MTALVVGGGVAGLSAAAWLSRYDAPFRWVTRPREFGGILPTVRNPIIDYPGLAGDGAQMTAQLLQWGSERSEPPHADNVDRIERTADGFAVQFAAGEELFSHVLLATGTRRRLLDVPGEKEGFGNWLHTSTTVTSHSCVGKTLLMVGGGDSAVEGALNLAEAGAEEVIVVCRSPLHAQQQFVERMNTDARIRVWPERATPTAFEARGSGARALFDSGGNVDVDAVFVRIGVEPVVPSVQPTPDTDKRGFLLVDRRCQTSVDRLYAAGDVTSTPLRSIATSVGDGARAARAIAEDLGIWT